MTRFRFFVLVAAVTACGYLAPAATARAESAGAGGKTCHLEQQCHWENFKKVCTWVKVCR